MKNDRCPPACVGLQFFSLAFLGHKGFSVVALFKVFLGISLQKGSILVVVFISELFLVLCFYTLMISCLSVHWCIHPPTYLCMSYAKNNYCAKSQAFFQQSETSCNEISIILFKTTTTLMDPFING